ncbi:MAG TPA: hypothetical protein VFN92_00690 [Solirubrobacterales bacterium]|nr:hypothetical protein [Solirubrobacterales bacterium]
MRHLDSVLRAFALVVTDRRWAAPLSAMALGFGLFLGVAIGPGAAGSRATGAGQVIAVAPSGDDGGPAEPAEAGGGSSFEPEEELPAAEPEALEPSLAEPALLPEPSPEPAPEETTPPREEPAPEETETGERQQLKGTVVHANTAAGSYAMAIAGGELVAVHAAKLPTAGEKLAVEAEPLENNTFAEAERKKTGTASQATARGVVTYVDPDPAAPAYTLSGRGSSILVHLPAGSAELPQLGAYATVGVGIEPPSPAAEPAPPAAATEPPACAPDPGLQPPPAPKRIVVQRTLKAEPEPATYFDLSGVLSGICPATGQLLISADDLRASDADLLLAVPPKLKVTALRIGDSVVATATAAEDGTLRLAGLASDEGTEGAEDTGLAQGDLQR